MMRQSAEPKAICVGAVNSAVCRNEVEDQVVLDGNAELALSLRIDFPSGHRLGPGKIQLLEAIEREGSIAAGGRSMQMSYRRAWLLVSEMNQMFGAAVVDTSHGGSRGGGARLTALGQNVVAHFRATEAKALRAASIHIDALRAFAAPARSSD
jgi:molybdate transport system regulatory protein